MNQAEPKRCRVWLVDDLEENRDHFMDKVTAALELGMPDA
jgi:hypothetical protein